MRQAGVGSAAAGGCCLAPSRSAGAKLGRSGVNWSAVRAWGRQNAALLVLWAKKARALREFVMEQEEKDGRTARTARNKIAAQLLDLERNVADIERELATCSSDIHGTVGAGWASLRSAAKSFVATGCTSRLRTKGSATSTREDDLRALLRTLLVDKRSMRARVGRRPAGFRRPVFRTRHMALAREFFKPIATLSSEADSGSERLARAVDGISSDDALAALRAEGESVLRARG